MDLVLIAGPADQFTRADLGISYDGDIMELEGSSSLSDFGFIIDFWFMAALALIIALPVTTAIVAIAGIAAYHIRKHEPARPLRALKWTLITIGPFWGGGLVFGSVFLANEIRHHVEAARRYFTLDKAAEINGVALSAGTRVELDSSPVSITRARPSPAILLNLPCCTGPHPAHK